MRLIDISGHKYGRLTVLHKRSDRKKWNYPLWLCQCECGKQIEALSHALRTGNTRSCGCLKLERVRNKIALRHGQTGSREHRCWVAMRSRCHTTSNKDFAKYGGRGIRVCERWQRFENFFADMGLCPAGYSIERIDNNGNYEPLNCKWIPMTEQSKNRRDLRRDETGKFMGGIQCGL